MASSAPAQRDRLYDGGFGGAGGRVIDPATDVVDSHARGLRASPDLATRIGALRYVR